MSSGYGLFYNLASLVGPVLGGALYASFGYQDTLDYNMIGEFIVFFIFLIFNCGPNVFSTAAKEQKLLDRMKEIELTIAVLDEEESISNDAGEYTNVDKTNLTADDVILE